MNLSEEKCLILYVNKQGGIVIKRIEEICNHPLFIEYSNNNKIAEIKRKFCKHDYQHSLDVARIAYILNLENHMNIDKEIIYAVGLLHDITKWKQKKDGTPHNDSALEPAKVILQECDFKINEINDILAAIKNHRTVPNKNDFLSTVIYIADKKSRMCYLCESNVECNWGMEKKNVRIEY